MKRATSMLGALALMAAGFLLTASAAQAAPLFDASCTRTNSGNQNWPYSHGVYYCTGVSTTLHNSMKSELYSLKFGKAPFYNDLVNAPEIVQGNPDGAEFYFMTNKAQYISIYTAKYGHAPATEPDDGAPAFTTYVPDGNGGNRPYYTVVFVEITVDGVTVANNDWANATIHEAGHWTDYYKASTASGNPRASDATLFNSLLTKDWQRLNTVTKCSSSAPSIFNGYRDSTGKYICNSSNTATIGGSPAVGDRFYFSITDVDLPTQNHQVDLYYEVQAGDTLPDIASGLAQVINANNDLSSIHITASSGGSALTFNIGSGNATSFAKSVTGNGSGTISLGTPLYGTAGTLRSDYTGMSAEQILKDENGFKDIFDYKNEIFAEEAAIISGNTDSGNDGIDHYFTAGPAATSYGRFACSELFVEKLIKANRVPYSSELTSKGCPTQ